MELGLAPRKIAASAATGASPIWHVVYVDLAMRIGLRFGKIPGAPLLAARRLEPPLSGQRYERLVQRLAVPRRVLINVRRSVADHLAPDIHRERDAQLQLALLEG